MESQRESANPFDVFSRAVLEFPAVLEMLHGYLSGPISEPLLEALEPTSNPQPIRRDLELVREALAYLRESPRPTLGGLKDTREILERVAIEGVSLAALEILAVVSVARAARDVRTIFLRSPFSHFDELVRGLADFRPLLAELDGKILPDGSLDSSASPELARIRRAMERLRIEIQSTLEKLLRRFTQEGVLQDAMVTIRNDRFVIPVRVEDKRRVAGIVHGASSSGASVFIEPMETLQLNNELVELQDREYAEIQRILAVFSARIRDERNELEAGAHILGRVDLAFAKGEFARRFDCCLPQFVSERALWLRDVRHPLLEKTLRAQGRKSMPLELDLTEPKTLMVVSGPNTGGKTVAMKTIGLAVLMAQAGLPVLASEARIPIFGRVLADIGDQQSIEANLSSFSAHVTKIQAMAKVADRNDLVLLDELGSSTEPNEGAALAIAIMEHFRARRAMTFVTTHHSRLKAYATETSEAVNAAMEFDEHTLQPTYRLLVGLPGKSNALEIAERLGLEATIIAKARSLQNPADAEAASLVASLHELKVKLEGETVRIEQQRREMEDRQASLERKFEQERKGKLKELDSRLAETIKAYEKKWEQTIIDLRAQAEAARLSKKAERKVSSLAQEVREEWNAQVLETLGVPPEAEEERVLDVVPKLGDRVRIADVSTPGTVVAVLGAERFEVAVGMLKFEVRPYQLKVLAGEADHARGRPAMATPTPSRRDARSGADAGESTTPAAEINVIGTTAEEARERLDKFLDEAFLEGRFRLRVIHGMGKGILRRTLHEMFSSHPHVEKFYLAPPQEGGAGATIVELKM